MAYLRTLERLCQHDTCNRKATFELLGRNGDVMGAYCAPHGRETLRECERHEQRAAQRADKSSENE